MQTNRQPTAEGELQEARSTAVAPSFQSARPESWAAALLGAAPFFLFGVAYAVKALAELGAFGPYADRADVIAKYAPPPIYFIAALGLLAGWLRRFPRWSIAYLGAALYFGWHYSNGRYYGVVYGWRAWLPLLGVAFIALCVTRSLRPLVSLVQGVWNDWTRVSFLIYSFLLPMATVVFFETDWGVPELVGFAFDTMLLVAGAVSYLRFGKTLHRVLALQIPMALLCVRYELMAGWYPAEHIAAGRPVSAISALVFLLGWCGLMFLPGVIGLLRRLSRACSGR